jgi:hypothetical protein
MQNIHSISPRDHAAVSFAVAVGGFLFAWLMADWISGGKFQEMIYLFLAGAVILIGAVILQNWRAGFYFFLFWVVFEDLARKYMSNNMAIYFGKDLLVLLIYLSLYLSIRRRRDPAFRPQFLIPIILMVWLVVIQAFNPYSPSPLYGALGLKVDFLYAGLMFVGYALFRNDEDIRRFITISLLLAAFVSVLGIIQSIVGLQFLNPATLAPEIRELAQLHKYSPISNEMLELPCAVFVSSTRFAEFMLLALTLGMGAAGYLLLYSRRGRILVWMCLGLIATGIVVSGSRGALVMGLATALVMSAAFIWGAPWKTGQVYKTLRAIRRTALVIGATTVLIAVAYPSAFGSKLAYYAETLLPSSSSYALGSRAWDYPLYNLELVFTEPHWVTGGGSGTATLGSQYVAKYLGQKMPTVAVESGYGTIIGEMGVLGLILWLTWTSMLVYYCWLEVKKLRQTRMFPLAFMAFWFIFVQLFPNIFATMNSYQDYIVNAYLWLFVGMLFRLSDIVDAGPVPVPAVLTALPNET